MYEAKCVFVTMGVSKRMLKYYAAGTHVVPKAVWPAAMHLASERAPASAMDPA